MLAKKFKLPVGSFPVGAKTLVRDKFATIKSTTNSIGFNRFGVIFRSGAFKTAVLRNKFKRIVFDSLQLEAGSHKPQAGGTDLLIILNPEIIKLDKVDLIKQFKKYGNLI